MYVLDIKKAKTYYLYHANANKLQSSSKIINMLGYVFIIFTIFLFKQSQAVHLSYKKDLGIITFYAFHQNPNGQGGLFEKDIHFKVDFLSKKFIINKAIIKKYPNIYMNKHRKNELTNIDQIIQTDSQLAKLIEYRDYSKKDSQQQIIQDGERQYIIDGVIGLMPDRNVFMKILKKSLNYNEMSILFESTDNLSVRILSQQCENPIRFPINLMAQGQKSKIDLVIQHLSTNLRPSMNFVQKVTGKTGSLFVLTKDQYQSNVKLQVNTKVQEVTLGHLLHRFCHKTMSSESYQCEIVTQGPSNQKKSKASSQNEFGSLPFMFDIAICERGIQIYSNSIEPQQTYYWIHYFVLFIQLIALLAYLHQEKVMKVIVKFMKKKKGY